MASGERLLMGAGQVANHEARADAEGERPQVMRGADDPRSRDDGKEQV